MNEKVILDIINSVNAEIWWLFIKLFVAAIIILSLKGVIESLAGLLRFAFSKRLAVGVKVKVNGADGVISNYNWRWIFIRVKGGDEVLIPMAGWQSLTWTIKDYYRDIYSTGEEDEGKS